MYIVSSTRTGARGMTAKYIWLSRDKLIAARRRRALTQEELAAISRVSRPTIAALETGQRPAYLSTQRKLARALRVDPAELVEQEGVED